MKKLLFIFSFALTFSACSNKPVSTENQVMSHYDSLLYNVFRAIGDSTYSCLDYKDDFYELLDTMQSHVESHPDEDVRIGAKSLSLELVGLCVYGDFLTSEEQTFFYDSLVLRFADVMSTWYSPLNFPNREPDWHKEPVLSQCIVFHSKDTSNTNQFIYLDMYNTPDNEELMVVTLPKEAEQFASIMFTKDDIKDFDRTSTFHLEDARIMLEKTEEDGLTMVFGKDLIDAMLSHMGMFIGYLGEEGGTLEDRYHDAHLLLTKFHEQYAKVKSIQ